MKLVWVKLEMKHVVPAGTKHPSSILVVHGVIQSALNSVQLKRWMQDCIWKALLIKIIFSLCTVCISFLWAVWTKIIQKAIPTNPQTLFYTEKYKKWDLKISFCFDVFLGEEQCFGKKVCMLYTCRLWFEADERNIWCHVWVTELFLTFQRKSTPHILSEKWWTEFWNHMAQGPKNENGAPSKSSELQNAKLIAPGFCFTCKTVLYSTLEFCHFYPSDSLLPSCWGVVSEQLCGAELLLGLAQTSMFNKIKETPGQVNMIAAGVRQILM